MIIKSKTQTAHFGIRMTKETEKYVNKRMKTLKLKRKQYFTHLLILDGYTVKPEGV